MHKRRKVLASARRVVSPAAEKNVSIWKGINAFLEWHLSAIEWHLSPIAFRFRQPVISVQFPLRTQLGSLALGFERQDKALG